MLHCVPAQIKSFKTTILDRGNKHEGERGTGGTMLIVRDHLCEGEGSPSACVFLFLFIVYFLYPFTSGYDFSYNQRKKTKYTWILKWKICLFFPLFPSH